MDAAARRDDVASRSRDSRCRRRWGALLLPHRTRLWSGQDITTVVTETVTEHRCDSGRAQRLGAPMRQVSTVRTHVRPGGVVTSQPLTARPVTVTTLRLIDFSTGTGFGTLDAQLRSQDVALSPSDTGIHRRAPLGDETARPCLRGGAPRGGLLPPSGSAGWSVPWSAAPLPEAPRSRSPTDAGTSCSARLRRSRQRGREAARQPWRDCHH